MMIYFQGVTIYFHGMKIIMYPVEKTYIRRKGRHDMMMACFIIL